MIITLYRKDAQGKVRVWEAESFKKGFLTRSGVLGGEIQEVEHPVTYGKVNRTRKEQIRLEMKSKANKKKDAGYIENLEDARAKEVTNSMGLARPMLAQPFDKLTAKDLRLMFEGLCYIQRKYDGHRCLITRDGDDITAYSRNGKPIESINHILEHLDIKSGMTLDGELYCHGEPLQTISSWVRRKQENSRMLSYVCYDIIVDLPFSERFQILERINFGKFAKLAETMSAMGEFNPIEIMEEFIKEGYEGAILRPSYGLYESGKRSKHLVKVKKAQDDEFLVKNIVKSKDGFGILVCELENKNTFRVTAPGTHSEKLECFENRFDYIGKKVRVEFYAVTNDGIPFHPVATMWRDKDGE